MKSTATLAGGCFWCTEAIFSRLQGVETVIPGYTGGTVKQPTYEQVCTGTTGHAEAIQIVFDPAVISYKTLLEVFFSIHDPTTLNRQGHDTGTQYRSEIFYHSEEQKQTAELLIQSLNNTTFHGNIVTKLSKAADFYPAETYHQRYYEKNSYQPYCQLIIHPKLQSFLGEYKHLINNS